MVVVDVAALSHNNPCGLLSIVAAVAAAAAVDMSVGAMSLWCSSAVLSLFCCRWCIVAKRACPAYRLTRVHIVPPGFVVFVFLAPEKAQ